MKQNDFSEALQALSNGEPIIYPTDTLYALGADIYNERAVQKIYALKKRPTSIPLPVAVHSLTAIETIAYTNDSVKKICTRFLPGSLTIVVQKKSTIPDIVTSGTDSIAVRIPNHPIALELLRQYGPLTVTSANLHNEKTQGNIKDILMQLHNKTIYYLDSGRLTNTPSTIVDLTTNTPRIIRNGPITLEQLQEVLTHG